MPKTIRKIPFARVLRDGLALFVTNSKCNPKPINVNAEIRIPISGRTINSLFKKQSKTYNREI
ncbi:hypothetical protein KAR91_00715 [Candidatus Pacearchaeota archaeon]|nr:hypothetical protein [Candidatus Pacearchaeota archaeon]